MVPKCALLSLVVQTLQEIILNESYDTVYSQVPPKNLLLLLDCFLQSYTFAKSFNECMGLRQALHKMGFMSQVPNLLKIETSSAMNYLALASKVFADQNESKSPYRSQIESKLFP